MGWGCKRTWHGRLVTRYVHPIPFSYPSFLHSFVSFHDYTNLLTVYPLLPSPSILQSLSLSLSIRIHSPPVHMPRRPSQPSATGPQASLLLLLKRGGSGSKRQEGERRSLTSLLLGMGERGTMTERKAASAGDRWNNPLILFHPLTLFLYDLTLCVYFFPVSILSNIKCIGDFPSKYTYIFIHIHFIIYLFFLCIFLFSHFTVYFLFACSVYTEG